MRLARGAAGVLVFLSAAPPAAGQSLRYGGEEGREDRYRLTNTARIHQELQGAATEMTVRSGSLLSLELESLEDDTLTYGVTFDSISVNFEGVAVAAPDLTPLLGKRMTLKLSRAGEVYAFDVPGDVPQAPLGFDLRHMVSHFFPRLPQGNVRPGRDWVDTLSFEADQQGIQSTVQLVTTYTSRGEREIDDRDFVEVAYRTATTISGKGTQGGTPLFLDGTGSGGGTILFAEGGETFWSSTGNQTLKLVVDVTPAGQPPMSIPIRQEITAEIQHF